MKEKFIVQGYHPAFRHDREDRKKGGGVLLLVKNCHAVVECTDLDSDKFEESVWCVIKFSKANKLLVGVCYRSPSSSADNNSKLIETFMKSRSVHPTSMLIMGDFNYTSINWEDGSVCGSEQSDASQFFEATQDLYLYQHVHFPTRFREGCHPSRLDLVFSSEEHMVDAMTEREPLGKSDHVVLTWNFHYKNKDSSTRCGQTDRPKYNFRKGRYDEMNLALKHVNWNVLGNMDVEDAWDFILKELRRNVDRFVPRINDRRSPNPSAPWWSRKLKQNVKLKYKAWKTYSKSRSSGDYRSYACQRNRTTYEIRKARQDFESRIIANVKKEPKNLFKYIRSRQQVKAITGPLEDGKGQMTEDDHQTAEVLHDFFRSVFVSEDVESLPEFPDMTNGNSTISHVTVTPNEVLEELKQLNLDKAAGPDGIPTILLKKCAEQLAIPLSTLFQKTLDESKIPNDWKKAKITPIFKKGTKKCPGNYRPVSLTSQPCKVLERILKRHITRYLDEQKLITVHQHGFVRRKSCQTNLLEMFEDCTKMLDDGENLDIVYLDFQKAFDTVPHCRLIKKLCGYGIKGDLLNWIKAFLTDRMQQVVINNSSSCYGSVTSGVPQGSVLGPVLFILYVNDLPTTVHSNIKMFADDTKLYRAINEPADAHLLQDDLNSLTEWSDKWLLKFNASKCKVMHCGSKNPESVYTLLQCDTNQAKSLDKTAMEKDLGVYVTNTFKPTTHCKKAANKAMSALKLLKIAFSKLNKENFKILYTTYVRPHLDYCAQAVGPVFKQDINALEKVQRRATKLVKELKRLPYPERLKQLDLSSISERIRRGDMIETYKLITGKVDIESSQFFEPNEDCRIRGHHLKIKKRRTRLLLRSHFFSNRAVDLWNKLPEDVVSAISTNEFKNKFDTHFAGKDLLSV